MDTSDLILYGGIAVLAYYFLSGNNSQAAPAAASGPSGSSPSPSPSAPSPTYQVAAPREAQIVLAQLQAMGSAPVLVAAQAGGQLPANGMLTQSQWNWYLQQVSGIPVANTGQIVGVPVSVASSGPVPIATWWAAVMQAANQAVINSQAAAATAVAGFTGQPNVTPAGALAGLGAILPVNRQPGEQPGQSANSNFPPPGSNEDGRFDFQEMAW